MSNYERQPFTCERMEAQAIAPASRNGTTLTVDQDPTDTTSVLTPCSRFESKVADIFKLRGVYLKHFFNLPLSRSFPVVNSSIAPEEERQNCQAIHVAGFYQAFNSYKLKHLRIQRQRGTRHPRIVPFIFDSQGKLLLKRPDFRQFYEDQVDSEIQRQRIEMPSSCKDIRWCSSHFQANIF
jgi:hypothetical protein